MCPVGEFNDVVGSVSCTSCGSLQTTDNSGAVSRNECVCARDSYLVNSECLLCPMGAVCAGHDEPPVPKAGYYKTLTGAIIECEVGSYCRGGSYQPVAANGRVRCICC